MEPASESSAHTGDGVTTPPKHVKPALKKNPAHSSGAKPGASSARKKKKGLKWDEEVIAEHDQLRGTRMKIDEPNTPYHYDSGAESDGSHQKSPRSDRPKFDVNLLQDKLTDVASYPASPEDSHGEDEEKKREFLEHRKKHYNEMELVKKFREEHPEGAFKIDEDEENDADVERD